MSERERISTLTRAIQDALYELGIPNDNYPAPVANAVRILRAQLVGFPVAPQCAHRWIHVPGRDWISLGGGSRVEMVFYCEKCLETATRVVERGEEHP